MKHGYIICIISLLCFVDDAQAVTPLTKDQETIAMTILGEARGEGYAGMYAVALVIGQRAKDRNKTPAQICLQRKQFSCWNSNDKNRPKLRGLLKTKEAYWAKQMAIHITKLNSNYTKQANHYCTLKAKPYWAKNKTPVIIIGNHKFFRLGK
jgi:N-acetylmuramoyl-L-alanine amidase